MRAPFILVCVAAGLVAGCGSSSGGGSGRTDPTKVNLRLTTSGTGLVRGAGADCRGSCSAQYSAGAQVHLVAVPDSGASFMSWAGACSGTGGCDLTLDADREVSATFVATTPPPAQHRLTVIVQGKGRVTSSPSGLDCDSSTCAADFGAGTSVTLTATAGSGFSFHGWGGACSGGGASGSSDCTLNLGGDATATATFTASPPPDECAALRPPSPGPAPRNHSVDRKHSTGTDFCAPGVSDGSGTLALILGFGGMNGPMQIDFVDSSSAALLTQGSGDNLELTGQLAGFEGRHFAGGGQYWLEAWDSGGHSSGKSDSRSSPLEIGEDPLGGIVLTVGSPLVALEAWDDHLKLRWRTETPQKHSAGFAVDRAGRTLVLFNGDDRYGANTVAGMWIDHDGAAGPVFQALGPQSKPAQQVGFMLTQRVGSGLFIGAGGKWVAQIDSLATSTAPAPGWLQARPNTRLHMVHGGSGYAVLPVPGTSGDCSQSVEVVAPSGTSCGTASFSAGSGNCDMKDIVVGYDGTVMQTFPDAKEKQCWFGACTCTWQWWPGFFR